MVFATYYNQHFGFMLNSSWYLQNLIYFMYLQNIGQSRSYFITFKESYFSKDFSSVFISYSPVLLKCLIPYSPILPGI